MESGLMNKRNTIIYVHPEVGEIWIDKNTQSFLLHSEKNWSKLNQHIKTLYMKCYGNTNKQEN
jgi:hypothetical protein